MSKGNREDNCGNCLDALLAQNKVLWAEAVRKIGDSENSEWCAICDQLFIQNNPITDPFDEIEITIIDS